jgi:hypothetical protein
MDRNLSKRRLVVKWEIMLNSNDIAVEYGIYNIKRYNEY